MQPCVYAVSVFGINTENKHYHLTAEAPNGSPEAYNRIGLPEIQYVNPLRANARYS